MPYITGIPKGPSKLSVQLSDGATDQYPQGIVYDPGANVVSTVNLTHVADGLYQGNTSNLNTNTYRVSYITYSDAGHTIPNTDYWYAEDVLDVFTKGGSSIRSVSSGGGAVVDVEKIADAVWRHKTAKRLLDMVSEIKSMVEGKIDQVIVGVKLVSEKVSNIRIPEIKIPEQKSELAEFKKIIKEHSEELVNKINSIEFEQDDVVTPITEAVQDIVATIEMPILDTSVIEDKLEVLKNRKQEIKIIRDDINIDKIIEQLTEMNRLIMFVAKDTKVKNIKTKLNYLQNKLRK